MKKLILIASLLMASCCFAQDGSVKIRMLTAYPLMETNGAALWYTNTAPHRFLWLHNQNLPNTPIIATVYVLTNKPVQQYPEHLINPNPIAVLECVYTGLAKNFYWLRVGRGSSPTEIKDWIRLPFSKYRNPKWNEDETQIIYSLERTNRIVVGDFFNPSMFYSVKVDMEE